MTKKIFLSLMAVLGLFLSAHAQEREITGSVKDHAGAGIVGATILVEGTTKGTTSGADGSFSIKAAPDNVLVVSFMGYQSHTIKVGTQTRIDVVLKENTQAIDDVIVVAFGTAKIEAFSGSAAVIKSDEIAKVQTSNVATALIGRVAGVQTSSTSGDLGTTPSIRVRGFGSINAGKEPLWIVDGMPYEGDLNNLNTNDIESMTVLKDAASNALYGARGANGVILITTKKGSADHSTHVSYSNNTTFSNPFVTHQFQNTYGRQSGDFKSWGEKLGKPSSYDPNDFFQTGYNTQNTVSVASSSERSQSFVSAGSVNSRGIIPNNEYSRYNFTIRHGRELVKDKLELDTDFFFTKSESQNGVAQGLYYNPLLPFTSSRLRRISSV